MTRRVRTYFAWLGAWALLVTLAPVAWSADPPQSLGHGLASGINDGNVVVGWDPAWPWEPGTDRGDMVEVTGWVAREGHRESTPSLGGSRTLPRAVNNDDVVVGGSENRNGVLRAFVLSDDEMVDIGSLGGEAGEALAVNDHGVVVGWSEDADGNRRAFRWHDGVMVDLGAPLGGGAAIAYGINELGQIVGAAETDRGTSVAVVWQPDGSFIDLRGVDPDADDWQDDYDSVAYGISDEGDVVGRVDYGPERVPFRFGLSDGTWQTSDMDGYAGKAIAVNNDGLAVGYVGDEEDGPQAFVWRRDGSYEHLPPRTSPGQMPHAINEAGVVVGGGGLEPGRDPTDALVWETAVPASPTDAPEFPTDDPAEPSPGGLPGDFPDIAAPHDVNIRDIAARGIARGYSDGTFRPGRPVSRAQMASFLVRAVELDPVTDAEPFSDVSGGDHSPNIAALAEAGIVEGFADGRYGPARPVTRGQMASFIVRAFELDEGRGHVTFRDGGEGTHAANIGVVAAVGIARGHKDGTFRPHEPVTRAQMATFLARALRMSP